MPFSVRTNMVSALRMVVNPWAMVNVVRPLASLFKDFFTNFSFSLSKAEVASSKISTGGFFKIPWQYWGVVFARRTVSRRVPPHMYIYNDWQDRIETISGWLSMVLFGTDLRYSPGGIPINSLKLRLKLLIVLKPQAKAMELMLSVVLESK